MTPTTVTIHNTDNSNPGAGAKAHSRFVRNTGYYIHKGKKNWVSWHFTVDDTFVIQHLPTDEVAFHAGSQANASSIAIEICMNPDSDESTANAKAAALAAHLIAKLGLGIGALRRHKDWTGKNCPSRLLMPSKWNAFVAAVRTELQNAATSASAAALEEQTLAHEPHVHAPQIAEDFEIDHGAIAATLGEESSALLFGDGRDPAEVLRSIVDELTISSAVGGPRLLFPHGITEIALTLPTGISLSVKGPTQGPPSEGAATLSLDDDAETGCEAPESDEADEVALAEPVDTQLPASTTTFYAYGSPNKRFGRARTIRAIEAIAAAYFDETGLRLGVGNISVRGGGPMPPHSSHQRGIDVDIRVPRRDAKETGATWQDSSYSRSKTQQLVDIARSNPVMPVRTILFNDTQISGVQSFKGHDNHLHISFSTANAASADLGGVAGSQVASELTTGAPTLAPATRPFAVPRSEGELESILDASGTAKVLVALTQNGAAGAAAAIVAAEFGAVDDTFLACFEGPDPSQGGSLAEASVALGFADTAVPPPYIHVFPRLGVALGTVSRDKIGQLRQHRLTRDVHLAPELSRIRPVTTEAASAPTSVEWGIERLRVPRAWRKGFNGEGIVVGHLDTGVDASHPALAGALHSFAEFDLTGRRIGGAQPRDSGRHGTHTAGTIAGRKVGARGQIGVAPGCQLASALVIEGGDVVARIISGLEWIVEQEAKVLSMSLGLRGFTTAFQVIIDALWDNDILPVIAVGNEFANSSRSPGNYTNILSVGAMSRDERVADFSSSQRFKRDDEPLVPDLVGPGVAVVSCVPGGGYERMSGTSMATPHIAGLAAILRQAAESANAKDVEQAILASCVRPASMLEARANRGVPDAIHALEILGAVAPARIARGR